MGKFLWTNQFPNYSLQPEGKGEVEESRVSWPELQLLLQRERDLGQLPNLQQVRKLCLVVGPA